RWPSAMNSPCWPRLSGCPTCLPSLMKPEEEFMTISLRMGLAALALPLALTGALAQDLDTLSPDELYEIAKTEGKVTVWSLSSRIAQVETAFEEKYPGIDFIPVDMNSTSQIARLIAE